MPVSAHDVADELRRRLGLTPVIRPLTAADAHEMGGFACEDCHSVVVAVRRGVRRRGLGRELKSTLLEEARSTGATAVVSYVHWDNEAMIELNARHGANIEQIPGDRDYCLCTIALTD